MSHKEWLKKMQKRMDWENEQADKGIEPYYTSRKKLRKILKAISRTMLVPPKVYDFLRRLKIESTKEEVIDLKHRGGKIFTIYTRKQKGLKIYNPEVKVDSKMFMALETVLRNQPHSLSLDENTILYEGTTGCLSIWGSPVYVNNVGATAELCKYMFSTIKCRKEWKVEKLCRIIDPTCIQKSDVKGKMNTLKCIIYRLNKEINNQIQIQEFLIKKDDSYIVNPLQIPIIAK